MKYEELLQVRVTKEIIESILEVAKRADMSKSGVVRLAISVGLKTLTQNNEIFRSEDVEKKSEVVAQ